MRAHAATSNATRVLRKDYHSRHSDTFLVTLFSTEAFLQGLKVRFRATFVFPIQCRNAPSAMAMQVYCH